MSRLRLCAAVLALVGAPVGVPVGGLIGACPAQAQAFAREVWTRADLEAAGVHRFADLVQLVGRWTVSVDGHAWVVSPDALPTAAAPRAGLPEWVLVVDGQRIDLSTSGIWFTELVPVLVHQIDSVEIVRTPTLAGGAFTSRGTLRVHTQRAPAGASVLAWARAGSETGDPGVYSFTPLATPNVDRTGYDQAVIAGYGRQRWGVQLSTRAIGNSVTDPQLEPRFDTRKLQAYTTVSGPALLAHADALGGRHTLIVARPVQDGFVFLPTNGRLERSNVALTQVGAAGALSRGGAMEVAYRLTRSDHHYQPKPDRFPDDSTHRRTLSHASLELRRRAASWVARAGLGADERGLRVEGSPDERRIHTTLFGAVERGPSVVWGQQAAAALVFGEGRVAFKGNVGARWSPDSARSLVGSLAVMQQLPDEGSAWIEARLLDGGSAAPLPERMLLWGEAVWQQSLVGAIGVEVGATVGAVAARGTGPAGARDASADRAFGADLEGGRVGVRVALSVNGSPRLRGRLVYHSVAPFAESEGWARAMATLPAHLLLGTLVYTPVPTLRLGAMLDIRSAAEWRDADPAALGGTEGEALEARARLDLTLDKWAWKRRLRAQLVVRNLANAPERYHPLGARFDQRYYLSASLALPPRS